MYSALEIAQYLLNKDPNRVYFNNDKYISNGTTENPFLEGSARLNKLLHMAQNCYIAKNGNKLFRDDLMAFANGAVANEVRLNYAVLTSATEHKVNLDDEVKDFLDRIFYMFRNATIEEMIDISHEDAEWEEKNKLENQKMDSLSRVNEYKEQYRDALKVMYRLDKAVL